MIPAVLEDRRLKTSLTRAFWACFCPCFSRIHSSYRDYTKPLFIAQHKLKFIFVFQDVSGRANDAAEKSTFYWSFPKEERNGVQVYLLDTSHGYHLISVWAMSQNPSLQKSMKKNSPKSTNSYVEKKSNFETTRLGSVHLHGTIFSHEVRDTNPSSSASCRSEMQNQRRCFFLKIQRARIFFFIKKLG